MSNPNFSPEYSSNSIWYGTDMDECLTDHIDDMDSDINVLQSGKADISHVHLEYAPLNHVHPDYSTVSEVSQLRTQIENKIDKVNGKNLSSNDYTNDDKEKLTNIEVGAQKNTITGIKGNEEDSYRTGNVNLTLENIGAAPTIHQHTISDITNGVMPISKGGTGAETVAGALTNFGNIGKVYSSTPNDKSIEKMEMVTIASLTLPAGVYVIVGNHQWKVNGAGCMYISRITKSDDGVVYCIVRSDMIGGGGAVAAAIVELTETTTIKYETYHQYTTVTNAEAIRFHAVKIR